MGKVNAPELVTLGETMYCLVPDDSGPLRYIHSFRPRVAGAESNLAIGLAKLGRSAAWISRLGNDEFGRHVAGMIRAEGVDLSRVIFDSAHRTGLMFKERTAGETKVYYYRENSAASHMAPEDVAEESLAGARILHLTGITPVLSQSCADTVLHAMDLADRLGVRISFDPNIRKRLWRDRDYAPLIGELTLRSHLVMLGLDEAEAIFGEGEPERVFDRLFGKGRAERAAIKDGANGAWVADASGYWKIPPIPCRCLEPIGAGDAFNAGFLAGCLEGRDVESCGRMGNIAGGLATQVVGDVEGYPSRETMLARLEGGSEIFR
ncbi:MAG: sugar kinase [Planctomycetota bacterium]|jgi:2-dehydro-3-deoxygluconokinase|nr:sugar kinase [Planctomycetota bacterium]